MKSGCRFAATSRRTVTLKRISIFTAGLFILMSSGQVVAEPESGFCCNCEMKWINEHPYSDPTEWYSLYDKYCDPYGNPKSPTTGVSVNPSTEMAEIKEKPYPKQEILVPASSDLTGLVLLDMRHPDDFNKGHLAAARNIYWKDVLAQETLDPAKFESALRMAGVNDSDRLLVYGEQDEGAFFAYWALRYLGHENVSLLDGGVEAAWKAGKKPDTSVPVVSVSNYTAKIVPYLLVNEANLEKFLNLSDLDILDARDFVDYGKSKLTNSSIPLTADKLYEDSKIKDVKTLEDMLNRRDLNSKGTQLIYGTPQAYSLFFGLKLMGYNATLLEGDWWQRSKWAVSNIR
jgi:thiosulfate/3-mercaptopyruvate sulfurtransferase